VAGLRLLYKRQRTRQLHHHTRNKCAQLHCVSREVLLIEESRISKGLIHSTDSRDIFQAIFLKETQYFTGAFEEHQYPYRLAPNRAMIFYASY
jgi:hypothetical protein